MHPARTHLAPADKDVIDTFNVRYIALVQQYYSVITGQFFAHWHRDEFKVFRAPDNTPINVAWLTSSITPYHNVNPSVRKYFYDSGASKAVLDYEVYFMNLSKANDAGVMAWEFEYSPLQAYVNVTDMSPATWLQFANTYMTNATLFQQFYAYHTVQCPLDPCTSKKCMKTMYCSTVRTSHRVCVCVLCMRAYPRSD